MSTMRRMISKWEHLDEDRAFVLFVDNFSLFILSFRVVWYFYDKQFVFDIVAKNLTGC